MQIYGLISFRFVITRWPYPTGITFNPFFILSHPFSSFLYPFFILSHPFSSFLIFSHPFFILSLSFPILCMLLLFSEAYFTSRFLTVNFFVIFFKPIISAPSYPVLQNILPCPILTPILFLIRPILSFLVPYHPTFVNPSCYPLSDSSYPFLH